MPEHHKAKDICASSSVVVGLRCLVEWSALLDSHEALDTQLLACLLNCCSPSLDVGVGLLAGSTCLAGDNLARLALHKVGLLQATGSLLLVALEHAELLANLHGFHGFHGLHCLHRLHGLHCLHWESHVGEVCGKRMVFAQGQLE